MTSSSPPTSCRPCRFNDGYVWAQTTVGTTVYAVGQFSNVRPAGAAVNTQLTPAARARLRHHDRQPHHLVRPAGERRGQVGDGLPDGKRIYLGGSFSKVNARTLNIAAVDATTGASGAASSSVGGSGVHAPATIGDTVYAGGLFTQANGGRAQEPGRVQHQQWRCCSPGRRPPTCKWTRHGDGRRQREGDHRRTLLPGGLAQVQRGLAALEPGSGAVITFWQAPSTVKNGWSSGSQAGKTASFAPLGRQRGVRHRLVVRRLVDRQP